ncbi:6072_t:CDS:2 [Acaulospora morrowiae]|uniref:6072_t:CDS:1 n=1 Tax=Acaulospora morrowiae TaxID=94023 RepID=A0A9N9ERZ0_9GLOM|nr:6072_t:CDS:2 [Acaulospora morrowiae]
MILVAHANTPTMDKLEHRLPNKFTQIKCHNIDSGNIESRWYFDPHLYFCNTSYSLPPPPEDMMLGSRGELTREWTGNRV